MAARARGSGLVGRAALSTVMSLGPDWRDALSAAGGWVEPPEVFTKTHAVNATIDYFDRRISSEVASAWASWILARPDITLGDHPLLREFLEEWAGGEIDDRSVDVWQSLLAHDTF